MDFTQLIKMDTLIIITLLLFIIYRIHLTLKQKEIIIKIENSEERIAKLLKDEI